MLDGFMKLKVIIADDEHRICQMLARFIDCEGLNLEIIDMAYDGEELLNKIRTGNPDIVITDICMPKESGMDVIRQAVQMGLTCKFIIISGFRQFDYAYTALKYDVSDYLLKPVDKNELNTALGKIAWQLRHVNDSKFAYR
jgi:two-component system response regulator YesN